MKETVKVFAVALCAGLFLGLESASAQKPATIHVNYVNAELGDVIRQLADVIGVNVVLTDVPNRRITFQTPAPVPASQAGAVLEGILESQGLVIVQAGPVAEVMPEDKRPSTGPVHVGKEIAQPPPLGLVTQIVPLDYMRADEAIVVLEKVAGKLARIEVVPRSNAVLITDRGVNVARYLDLLRQLDVKSGGESGLHTYVYPLKHASAVELAGTLGQVFNATVLAPQGRARVQALEGKSLSSQLTGFHQRELQSAQQRAGAVPAGFPAPVAAAPASADTLEPPGARPELIGGTTIVPDQATNSLVIRTAPPNYSVLQSTIDQLDTRPPQVLLEVLIAEVTLDHTTQYGINWQVFSQKNNRSTTIGVGQPQFSDSVLAGLQGLGVRVISLAGIDVRTVIQALASKSNVRVLSAPHVLALNNEQARILVGSEVPFNAATLNTVNAVDQVVQFQNVGTQLTVLPTINHDGYVTLRILQEVSAVTEQVVATAQNAPIITTREAETSAIIKTGHTIVIGGMIGETHDHTETGVPLLKDIPIFGYLFKSETTTRARSELAIFLTPYVVYSDEQADSLLRQERQQEPLVVPQVDSLLPGSGHP
jgi:general secretion pathway protein D